MSKTESTPKPGLLAAQWAAYRQNHRNRRNLLVHALTVPLFMFGTVAVAAGPMIGSLWTSVLALAAMGAALALQGRAHATEANRPTPFASPLNAIIRLFAEQWITFPRYVLTGNFTRTWRSTTSA